MNRAALPVCLTVLLTILVVTYVASRVYARENARSARFAIAAVTEAVVPLRRAHAHNDYEHSRPLFDALSRGFSSVEADVWLSRGKLLVAHLYWQTSPDRTLSSLYLEPLRKRIEKNKGSVYRGSSESVQLLIDVKTDGSETYEALHEELERYSSILTSFERGQVRRGAVTAIISGNCPRDQMAKQRRRFAACDGRIDDLRKASPASLVPLVSEDWDSVFDWSGSGAMPRAERAKLQRLAKSAHARGQKLRFWSTPDDFGSDEQIAVWLELIAAGVDYINSDALDTLRGFLLRFDRPELKATMTPPWSGAPILSAR